MLIVQDKVWGRVTQNRAEKRSTRYYIDEFHLLLKEPQTAAYSVEIWKRFRKWGGIPTGITQNINDLMLSPEIENIFQNSDFVYMLSQVSNYAIAHWLRAKYMQPKTKTLAFRSELAPWLYAFFEEKYRLGYKYRGIDDQLR